MCVNECLSMTTLAMTMMVGWRNSLFPGQARLGRHLFPLPTLVAAAASECTCDEPFFHCGGKSPLCVALSALPASLLGSTPAASTLRARGRLLKGARGELSNPRNKGCDFPQLTFPRKIAVDSGTVFYQFITPKHTHTKLHPAKARQSNCTENSFEFIGTDD